MEQGFNTDICVIGGGPAGSVIAKQLAKLNHQILLVEKAQFPRQHVGICLSETTNVLLNHLGVHEEMEKAGFWKRKQTFVTWNTEEPVIANQPGMHVDRGKFDHILLDSAQNAGVSIQQSMRVISVKRDPMEGWHLKLDKEGQNINVKAKFLVDASGRANVLSNKKIRYAPPLFSLHANWELKSDSSCDGLMEAGEAAWLWIAHLGNRKAMISVYSDPKRMSESKMTPKGYYLSILEQFSGLKYFERNLLISKVHGCDASSRYNPDPVGKDYIRVGDACLSVDPMASQGVHLALSSSIQAAVVVNTLIRYPENTDLALDFYRNSQKKRIKQFVERTAFEYARASVAWPNSFWKDRSKGAPLHLNEDPLHVPMPKLNTGIQLCDQTQFLPTPVLQETKVSLQFALHHPILEQPVAYLGNQSIVPLLKKVRPKQTVDDIISQWKTIISPDLSQQIFQWLWQHKILIAVEN